MKVIIDNEVMRLIKTAAKLPFKQTGKRLSDGNWSLDLDDDLYNSILNYKFKEETVNEFLFRLLSVNNRPLS